MCGTLILHYQQALTTDNDACLQCRRANAAAAAESDAGLQPNPCRH